MDSIAVAAAKVEEAKRLASVAAVDDNLLPTTKVVGVGSGSTIIHVVDRLREKMELLNYKFICIPTSFQAKNLINSSNLTIVRKNNCGFYIATIESVFLFFLCSSFSFIRIFFPFHIIEVYTYLSFLFFLSSWIHSGWDKI